MFARSFIALYTLWLGLYRWLTRRTRRAFVIYVAVVLLMLMTIRDAFGWIILHIEAKMRYGIKLNVLHYLSP